MRIGPKMRAAVAYVTANPGCPKYKAAKAIGPHGSARYGSAAVIRAIAAGLIVDRGTTNKYALYPA